MASRKDEPVLKERLRIDVKRAEPKMLDFARVYNKIHHADNSPKWVKKRVPRDPGISQRVLKRIFPKTELVL